MPSAPASRRRWRPRLVEADEFYQRITPLALTEDERRVHRQALAGMLWSKQYYLFDVDTWLKEHHGHPLVGTRQNRVRNAEWFHMFNGDVISMPDKWEYPWYAAWDLAFHTLALSLVDFDFAKDQLLLMLRSLYAHPTARFRRTSGTSATSTRRCTPGRRCSSTRWSARSDARTANSWNARSRA